ncbi:hypothetical protein [Undibacterium sp. TC9W]
MAALSVQTEIAHVDAKDVHHVPEVSVCIFAVSMSIPSASYRELVARF